MSNKGFKLMLATSVLGIAAMAMPVGAQPGGGAGGRGAGGAGARGGRGAAVTTALTAAGATTDDMAKITPLLTAVQTAQAATQIRAFGGGRGGGGGGGGGMAQPSELANAVTALTTALADTNTSADDIKTKLKAVRDAKAKAMDELKKAQKALTEVLSPKEEAVLVAQGILE